MKGAKVDAFFFYPKTENQKEDQQVFFKERLSNPPEENPQGEESIKVEFGVSLYLVNAR